MRIVKRQFTALPGDLGFNDGLPAPKPDMAEGLHKKEFSGMTVVERLGGVAVPQKEGSLAFLHFAAEFKSGTGNMMSAEAQAGYDGAAMVYGWRVALAAISQADPPGHGAVNSIITWYNLRRLHPLHEDNATAADDRKGPRYHQYSVANGRMNTYAGFKLGKEDFPQCTGGLARACA